MLPLAGDRCLWASFVGQGMPRDASPCGHVIDCDHVLLFADPSNDFPTIEGVEPAIEEVFLAPFHLDGVPVGTVWVLRHAGGHAFDLEDRRRLVDLAQFASAAFRGMRTQAAASQVRERLDLALQTSQIVGLWEWRVPQNLVYADERFARWFGVDPAQAARGEPIESFLAAIHPDDRDRVSADIAATLERGLPFSSGYRLVTGGTTRHVMARGHCERDQDGKPVRFPGVIVDITEQREVEAALEESALQFKTLAQAMPNQVWTARPDGVLDWLNEQTYAYSGTAQDGSHDIDWTRIVHPDDMAEATAAWDAALKSGQPYEAQFRLRRHDGVYRWHLARAVAIRGADGAIVHWIGTSTDIEDQKVAAKTLADLNRTLENEVQKRTVELQAAEEALRQSQKMEAVGHLTGGLAHDFNNLLTGISGSLQLIDIRAKQGKLDAVERYVGIASEATRRAAALTQRLLAFSRRQTLDPRPANVNKLVVAMEELINRTIGPSIVLELKLEDRPWPTLVDANQLENALLNLCINARDAMPEGGRLIVETANRTVGTTDALRSDVPGGDYVALSVTDSGTGMTPDVAARAFDPFYTTKPIGQGTGLGLSMIYGFARQSGGHVWIESTAGVGTSVTIIVPRSRDAEPVAEDRLAAPPVHDGRGRTVLVVDDEEMVRSLVRDMLAESGFGYLEAADGMGAMDLLRGDRPIDLLITDVGLPGGMNGRQIADAARELRPTLKVIFITGYADKAAVGGAGMPAGMAVIPKPFSVETLTVKLREMLDT